MKLVSATVRNYRIHRETTVDFDPSRTLIAGPNEAGKSTFIEAVHRALFLKATVTGEARASMESMLWPGHPEVEVCFQTGGQEYRLVKRFSGPSGTTRLTLVGGATWQGDEAQSRLVELLGVSDVGGGRGILDRVAQQWAHLWVWQGSSGDDPVVHLSAQQTCLLEQLQEAGGAVAMQSALDGRVAARFAEAKKDVFTQSGAARRGSELDAAQTEVARLETAAAEARARVIELRSAVEDYEHAVATIAAASSAVETITRQSQAVEKSIRELEGLRRAEEAQTVAVESAQEKTAILERVDKEIADLQDVIEQLQHSLEPMEVALAEAEERCGALRRQSEESDQSHDRLIARTRETRLARELAEAYVVQFQQKDRLQELRARISRVSELQTRLDGIQGDLARLPSVGDEDIARLRGLEAEIGQARAALGGMATEVEVVVAGEPVRLGEDALRAGDRRTITDPTVIQVGMTHIKVFPGGGAGLSQAREKLRLLTEELQKILDRLGLTSMAQAAEAFVGRKDLVAEADTIKAALQEWDPDRLRHDIQAAEQAAEGVTADIRRRIEQVAEPRSPVTSADAEEWLRDVEDELHSAELTEEGARQACDALRVQYRALESDLVARRTAMTEDRNRLLESRAQLNLLVANHGTDGLRRRALQEARSAQEEAEALLVATREAIATLQPDLLEADRDRLERALSEAENQKQTAITKRAVSQEKLRSEGTTDPAADLELAEARLESAGERLAAAERQAAAVALVDRLFREEQQVLADRFSQPLAEKISDHLQSLFGPGAKATVTFCDNSFQSIELVRRAGEGAIDFSALSGGTREQVAAAVRLAVAELLAAGHDGSLPVVFDDSFAYSDPERVQTLQRMLDLGSRRGLQIIVLTCNPGDYTALGAGQTVLRPEQAG
ncbi:MAG: AAA family ATPase [Thermoleophilia bacterium]